VTFSYHASNEIEPLLGRINLSLAVVVAPNEKGSFGIVACQEIEKLSSMLAWAVVEGKSNGTFFEAMLDPLVVRHFANKWTCICGSVSASGDDVTVTSAECLLAALRDLTVVGRISLFVSVPRVRRYGRSTDTVASMGAAKVVKTLLVAKGWPTIVSFWL
jgi:hypothetical protein